MSAFIPKANIERRYFHLLIYLNALWRSAPKITGVLALEACGAFDHLRCNCNDRPVGHCIGSKQHKPIATGHGHSYRNHGTASASWSSPTIDQRFTG
jgi:hypothetical protein